MTYYAPALAILLLLPLQVAAQNATVIAPVFSQLITGPLPDGFAPVFENANATGYINEAVLKGETIETWTQLITLTGAKGLAVGDGATTAIGFADYLAGSYKSACPDTAVAEQFETPKIRGAREVFMGYLSCGSVNNGPHSESMVFLVMVGAQDIYTLQWAERGDRASAGLGYAVDKWAGRLDLMLKSVRLCEILSGEAAPYPSCTP